MKNQKLDNLKKPIVKINKELNRFKGKVIFQKKLDSANKMLENVVLPNVNAEKSK